MSKMIRINLDLGDQTLTFTCHELNAVAFLDQLSWKIAVIRHQITMQAVKQKKKGGGSDDSGTE